MEKELNLYKINKQEQKAKGNYCGYNIALRKFIEWTQLVTNTAKSSRVASVKGREMHCLEYVVYACMPISNNSWETVPTLAS